MASADRARTVAATTQSMARDYTKGVEMERVAVIAKLKPDVETRAEELIKEGPPFDPQGTGFERHAVFLSGDQAVFVFEGGKLDELLQAIIRAPKTSRKFRAWEPLLDGLPKVAREAYFWQRGDAWPEGWGE